jgi:hypothetical protein
MAHPSRANSGPDFVGIGVQKSGTTWLGDIFSQHPEVLFAPQKEVNFYTRRYHRGYRWYEDIFRKTAGQRAAGEISVNYMYSPRPDNFGKGLYPNKDFRRLPAFWRRFPAARDELKAHYPNLRILAMFRNPADRAWSHYWYWRRRRERLGKRIFPFEKMFADDGRWIRLQGNFADHLAYWREKFPDIGVFFYDDLLRAPAELAREAYRFIGVDENFKPDLTRRFKASSSTPMTAQTRQMLIDAYREQILRFSEMTGRDLSQWLDPEE